MTNSGILACTTMAGCRDSGARAAKKEQDLGRIIHKEQMSTRYRQVSVLNL